MSIDALDTKEEIDEVMEFIKRNKEANAKKIA
jgi:hypothetical protein